MSCAQPDDVMPRRRPMRQRDKNLCHRCQASRPQYISRSLPLCEGCFQSGLSMRCSRDLHLALSPGTRSSNVRPRRMSGDVLLALSGGAGSVLMLNMLHKRGYWGTSDGEVRDRTKGYNDIVWPRAWAVHVDFTSVTGLKSQTERLRMLAEEKGMRFLVLNVEDAFDPSVRRRIRQVAGVPADAGDDEDEAPLSVNLADPDLSLHNAASQTPLEALRALLAGLPAPSRPTLLGHILDGLIALAAQTLPNIAHVLEGETSTRQAERVIGATAGGRGWALPLELASRAPMGAAVRIKPMKDITVKEAAICCRTAGLETANERRWDGTVGEARRDARGKGAFASIEALTERFIATLNVSHPSTVNTINRTGNKLQFAGTAAAGTARCPVCAMPADDPATAWKARASLTALPGRGPETAPAPEDAGGVGLRPLLCYSCLTALTPLTAAKRDQLAADVPLPLWVGGQTAQRRGVSQEEMRRQIDAFILDDGE